MILEHVAMWTADLERLKAYYENYFDAKAGEKYTNPATGFQSYFLSFASGARLEIMSKAGIPANKNDTVDAQYLGLTHLAFGVADMKDVEEKAAQLQRDGYKILRGPRKTGDGYYEFETLDPDNNRLEVTTECRKEG